MTKHKKQKKRFRVYYEQEENMGGVKIYEDTLTGLSYLYVYGPGQGGLTVLLDEDGEPAVVPDN